MKVEVYLVKDEYSTVANFNTFSKAAEYIRNKKDLTVERIEVEAPKWRHIKTVAVENITKQELPVENKSERIEDIIDIHILNVYNRTSQNKSKTAKIVGLTYKTILKRLKNMGAL
jgi:transcriptional regulator with PAS, ATPase and Fis domain